MAGAHVLFRNVSKSYGRLPVVGGVDLEIRRGEFLSLLGPSGSGKTTLLMMLAGFESVSGGEIVVDGVVINHLPPHRRHMGVVFQNYALFPHMTVGENVAFSLRMRGVAKAEIAERVVRALDLVQLGDHRDRLPRQLSGGQQQRVALARALIFEPKLVLMDEPLGALDKQLRERMQLDIRELHQRLALTIVFVTHDQGEALTMSDRLAVLNRGRIVQLGTPRKVYDEPADVFVAAFIGETNLLDALVQAIDEKGYVLRLSAGDTLRVRTDAALRIGDRVRVSLRQESIELAPPGASGPMPGTRSDNRMPATITDIVYQGDRFRVEAKSEAGTIFIGRLHRLDEQWRPGSRVHLSFASHDCRILAA